MYEHHINTKYGESVYKILNKVKIIYLAKRKRIDHILLISSSLFAQIQNVLVNVLFPIESCRHSQLMYLNISSVQMYRREISLQPANTF